jgi:hypothetical protein
LSRRKLLKTQMGFLKRLAEIFKEEPLPEPEKDPRTLENLCKGDEILYKGLSQILYLEPRGNGSFAEAIADAERVEKGQEPQSRLFKQFGIGKVGGYSYAACLALYENNIAGVRQTINKLIELKGDLPEYAAIRDNPEKAIEISQEYYGIELARKDKQKRKQAA